MKIHEGMNRYASREALTRIFKNEIHFLKYTLAFTWLNFR